MNSPLNPRCLGSTIAIFSRFAYSGPAPNHSLLAPDQGTEATVGPKPNKISGTPRLFPEASKELGLAWLQLLHEKRHLILPSTQCKDTVHQPSPIRPPFLIPRFPSKSCKVGTRWENIKPLSCTPCIPHEFEEPPSTLPERCPPPLPSLLGPEPSNHRHLWPRRTLPFPIRGVLCTGGPVQPRF